MDKIYFQTNRCDKVKVKGSPYPSILSALQPWVSLGLLTNQTPFLSVFRLLHPLLYLCQSKLLSSTSVSHPSEADCWVLEQIIFMVWDC